MRLIIQEIRREKKKTQNGRINRRHQSESVACKMRLRGCCSLTKNCFPSWFTRKTHWWSADGDRGCALNFLRQIVTFILRRRERVNYRRCAMSSITAQVYYENRYLSGLFDAFIRNKTFSTRLLPRRFSVLSLANPARISFNLSHKLKALNADHVSAVHNCVKIKISRNFNTYLEALRNNFRDQLYKVLVETRITECDANIYMNRALTFIREKFHF